MQNNNHFLSETFISSFQFQLWFHALALDTISWKRKTNLAYYFMLLSMSMPPPPPQPHQHNDPHSTDEIHCHSKQDPPKGPRTLARRGEPMSHDDCACYVARCLWSVCAILISLGISFHILLPANAIVFWKFDFPLGWINYYYWQI